MFYIKNNDLEIAIKDVGAELSSVKSVKTGKEYLWQGDKNVWSGQSPILFPIVGGLINNKYTLGTKEYSLCKHGFAKDMQFLECGRTENSLSLSICATSETKAHYPYNFELIITYTLCENKLKVSHTVHNLNDGIMYFSLGAHPAFNCVMGDYVEFSEMENIKAEKIDINALVGEVEPCLENNNKIVITENIFNNDALILSGFKSKYVCVKSDNHSDYVKVTLGNAPYLGIWAKPGAKYVCIEPWYGVNDYANHNSKIEDKKAIQVLQSGKTFDFEIEIEIINM